MYNGHKNGKTKTKAKRIFKSIVKSFVLCCMCVLCLGETNNYCAKSQVYAYTKTVNKIK